MQRDPLRSAALVAGILVMFVPATVPNSRRFEPRFSLRQITQIRTIGQFALSPDGRQVAYTLAGFYFEFPVTPRFGEENNIRVLTLTTGESRRVTAGAAAKTNPVFSPDGSRIAFESDGDIWVADVANGATERMTMNGARDSGPSWSPDGRSLVFVSGRGGSSDLWITSAQGEAQGLRRLTTDPLIEADPQWSPDGRTVVYTAKSNDEFYSQSLFGIPAEGGVGRRLLPDDGFDHSTARWSPDGRRLAYLSDRSGYVHVWIMDAGGREPVELDTGPHDSMSPYWTIAPVWSRDSRSVLIPVNRDGSFDLARLDARTRRVETIATGGGHYHAVGWSSDGRLVYGFENAWSPPDLFMRDAAGTARQLTSSSHAVFRQDHMAEMRRVHFASLDGLDVHGFLLLPRGRQTGERLPAVLALHPNAYGQFYDHWSPFFHYLAESGFIVCLFDQRGSSGYGRKFREAQIGAWGTKTLDDVKAAAAFLRAQPFVDGSRVGVMGLSFGGYQALLGLTKTNLFQAGVDLMGPTDRRGAPSDKYRALQIGAFERDNPELYARVSPITTVTDLRAPLLILHSDEDRNVAPEQTYRLMRELDRLGKPYEVKIYPGESHGLADPAHQLDSYERIVRFFDRHLRR